MANENVSEREMDYKETCEVKGIHEEVVDQLNDRIPAEESMQNLADLFKAFSDPTRVKILWALSQEEICVCDLSALLQISQSAISHQLRSLKQAHLVKNRRDGKVVYYSLADTHVLTILAQGLEHINE